MPQAKRKPAESKTFTYADYGTWPEETRCELIDGVVYDMTPAPSVLHATISINLATELNTFFREKSCRVFNAPFVCACQRRTNLMKKSILSFSLTSW